jgi:hypothetical protein
MTQETSSLPRLYFIFGGVTRCAPFCFRSAHSRLGPSMSPLSYIWHLSPFDDNSILLPFSDTALAVHEIGRIRDAFAHTR